MNNKPININQVGRAVFTVGIITVSILFSCQKKSNSRNGEIEPEYTTSTTGGTTTGGSTTSGTTTGTIPTGGTPTCTLNPRQVTSSFFFPSLTHSYGYGTQNIDYYSIENSSTTNSIYLYFEGNAPVSGTYSVTSSSPITNPGFGKVGIRMNQSTSMEEGYGRSGLVYVVSTGTNITATFCDVPVTIYVNPSTTYTSIVSAKVVN